jgi:hypothetical protein
MPNMLFVKEPKTELVLEECISEVKLSSDLYEKIKRMNEKIASIKNKLAYSSINEVFFYYFIFLTLNLLEYMYLIDLINFQEKNEKCFVLNETITREFQDKVQETQEPIEAKPEEENENFERKFHHEEQLRREAFERRLAECDKLEQKCNRKREIKVHKTRAPIKIAKRPASVHSSTSVYTRPHGEIILNRRKEKKPVAHKPSVTAPTPVKNYVRNSKSPYESKRIQIVEKIKEPERVRKIFNNSNI